MYESSPAVISHRFFDERPLSDGPNRRTVGPCRSTVALAARWLGFIALLVCGSSVQALVPLAAQGVELCRVADEQAKPEVENRRLPVLRCEQVTSLWSIDPQGQMLWVRAVFDLTPEQRSQPLAVYLFAKASTRFYLNGHDIGANGYPSADRAIERAGLMDARVYLPPELLRERGNELVLQMSSHHGWLHLANPIHFLGIGEYGEVSRYIQQFSKAGLVMLGCFAIGVLYFGVVSIGSDQGFTYRLFALMSGMAGLQLWVELSRAYVNYAYPVHDLRILAVSSLSAAFGVCLLLYILRRCVAPPRHLHWLYSAILVTVVAMMLAPGFDMKTTLGTWIPVTVASAAALRHWRQQRESEFLYTGSVLAAFSVIIVLTLSYFHELLYFLLVAVLLGYLFVQQGMAFSRQREQRMLDQQTITRLRLKLEQRQQIERPTQLTVTLGDSVERVASNTIAYCKADGDYSLLCLQDDRELLFTGSLKRLQSLLPSTFLRVHRSYLVNLDHVGNLQRSDGASGGVLSLVNGKTVPVSRRLMADVREAFLTTEPSLLEKDSPPCESY